MKKLIVWLLVILILTVSCIYIFIPAKIVISRIIIAEAQINGVFRNINQEDKWEKWWRDSDGKPHVKGEPFTYNGSVFHLTKYENNVVGIEIDQKGLKLQSQLFLVSFNPDSTGTTWKCEIPASNNPLTRLLKYNQALKISKNMHEILQNLKHFISSPQNVYGFTIYKTSTRDTTMLSAKFISTSYPTTTEIYGYLNVLERNIQKQKGKITGFPILNVRDLDSMHFETQVALPTDRLLENNGEIFYRRMVPGNFLCADVKGGPNTIQEAMLQMNFYIQDFNKSKMAKSFEQLVTNRLNEPDTSKWITRVYQPIVN
jgi:hypothetical protein